MSKIGLIISREYITRVRKKSFIIMSIVGPLLFAGIFVIPIWLTKVEDTDQKVIGIVEYSELDQPVPDSLSAFNHVIKNQEHLRFDYLNNTTLENAKKALEHGSYYGILFIPHSVFYTDVVELYSKKQPSMGIESHISKSLEKFIQNEKLKENNVNIEVLKSVKTDIKLKTIKLDKGKYEEQGENVKNIRRGFGYVSGFLIYFFIFFFGAMVMRGVVEEKTNRIVEVIISSVKPFQLMIGKIIGVGLVGLTQFVGWMVLTGIIVFLAQTLLMGPEPQPVKQPEPGNLMELTTPEAAQHMQQPQNAEFKGVLSDIKKVNFLLIIGSFIFYFLGGFLLYGALFAAIGSAVDNETETQQFMLPVTIPLVISMLVMLSAITDPEGQVAFWFSIIPFTSPVVMMARIPSEGVSWPELALSMSLLILTFLGITWMAAKIYRTGILMYGKKVNYKEIVKWLKYKN